MQVTDFPYIIVHAGIIVKLNLSVCVMYVCHQYYEYVNFWTIFIVLS